MPLGRLRTSASYVAIQIGTTARDRPIGSPCQVLLKSQNERQTPTPRTLVSAPLSWTSTSDEQRQNLLSQPWTKEPFMARKDDVDRAVDGKAV